jgi:hypothetical protein
MDSKLVPCTILVAMDVTTSSPYFLLFSHKSKLLASIQCDITTIMNLVDPIVWPQACEQ